MQYEINGLIFFNLKHTMLNIYFKSILKNNILLKTLDCKHQQVKYTECYRAVKNKACNAVRENALHQY